MLRCDHFRIICWQEVLSNENFVEDMLGFHEYLRFRSHGEREKIDTAKVF